MHQAIYEGDRRLRVRDVPETPPAAGEVQIDVAFTGICGTDLHILHGDMDGRVAVPAVIGHEMSGTVARLGAGVDGWAFGDPVTVLPVLNCGACATCRAGHGHVCPRLTFIGIDSAGSMQQRWNVPARALVRLPADLDLAHAALAEPTAVAVHDVRRSGLTDGEHAVVVGGGPVGLLIAVVARRTGAQVLILEPSRQRLAVADRLGFATADPTARDAIEMIQEWTGGEGAAVAFEVSGAAAGVSTAVDALAPRGRLVMVAIHSAPREVNLHRFFWRELTMLGARLYSPYDMATAVELVAAGEIPAADLISRVEPLHRVDEAFAALESGAGVMKVLLDCAGRP
ncbi:2-desacetyl-2-hydroxyethyl bacteriochlorophyllide A dehydrogenase [Allocatelliglobosispora scoriae]|uniref:2-desacetyl-2-hydroxyethyl bacteriochlorophyllide A dehydrogenase n=1 Tax=Allocatelliglobosispora scoriae TaxID=643052 RepID=A0A841BI82_9ACTN|nr:alcohol dehydrogenase catalytic domain-containing protein [Allocatelliglobosispora scoriae]MBB5866773.1 2-desacetyl-2-hydroxyethyl bacteriochlorophyllide A dehydrogenase [Allocatelliglobosispora scoriae]